MTRLRAVIAVVVFAIALAGFASWMVFDYLNKKSEEASAGKGQKIVVAATEIPAGSKINATQLKMVDWPKDSLVAGSFTNQQTVIDRVNVRPLSPGDPVIESKLMPMGGSVGTSIMSYIIPAGHRAVTVAVNEVAGVAGFLSPHNKVDLVVTTLPPGSTDPNNTISKIVLQNIPILATGQITDQKEGKPVVVPTVTIDLTPEDAEKLVLASSKGSLQLLLRGITDSAPTETRGATISKVLGGTAPTPVERVKTVKTAVKKSAPKPVVSAPPATPVNTVEIIKGTTKTVKQY